MEANEPVHVAVNMAGWLVARAIGLLVTPSNQLLKFQVFPFSNRKVETFIDVLIQAAESQRQ
jgi:hypothetical protein